MSRLQFKLEARASGSKARAGQFTTLHSTVKTPVFMPVGTKAAVRAQDVVTLADAGSQVLLANTYHLLLRPGPEVFERMGGIQKFMNWKGSVLTDSGGYQIFCLPHSRKMTEEGATFQSYVDKRMLMLSPEQSISMQKSIGSDIMMVLDHCIPSTAEHAEALDAMHRTHRWAERSLAARGDSAQSMFAIVQGACHADLRKQSAEFLTQLPFDGFAIGGLAVGETKSEREDFTELTADLLPSHLPRYLMGVGTPIDLLEAVHRGVDMFDCILPTAMAQQGVAFTSRGRVDLRRGIYRLSEDRLDPGCSCSTCEGYSRSYLRHLIKCGEYLGCHLIGVHNLNFYHRLMAEMRSAIFEDTFAAYYREKRPQLMASDEDNPKTPPKRTKVKKVKRTQLGDYEVVVSPAGHASIRQLSSGETMHSVSEPMAEATRLYVEQSRLKDRIRIGATETVGQGDVAEIVIWDVGLGAATNAMAAIHAYEEVAQEEGVQIRPIHIVSFENDLNSLKLALEHNDKFTYLRHAAPAGLMKEGKWQSKQHPIQWTLIEGHFLDQLADAPQPDLVFYDPFSYKADQDLWSLPAFTRLYSACHGKDVELFTYSGSTAVRATLLAAGFFVARGAGTGPKAETTVALVGGGVGSGRSLLDAEWLSRWERSQAKVPEGIGMDVESFVRAIREHAQFRDLVDIKPGDQSEENSVAQ